MSSPSTITDPASSPHYTLHLRDSFPENMVYFNIVICELQCSEVVTVFQMEPDRGKIKLNILETSHDLTTLMNPRRTLVFLAAAMHSLLRFNLGQQKYPDYFHMYFWPVRFSPSFIFPLYFPSDTYFSLLNCILFISVHFQIFCF